MNQDRISRAVLLIEMDSGVQHGFSVDPCCTVTSEWENPEPIGGRWWDSSAFYMPVYGTLTIEGRLTTMHKMPTYQFDDESEIAPERIAIESPRLELQ